MQRLNKLYIENGFPNVTKLWKLAKEENIPVTYKQLKEFYQNQSTYQLHKKVTNKIVGRPISTTDTRTEFQMDLLDMSKFYRNNHGKKWILIVVDIFSRKAYARALSNKTALETSKAIKDIFDHITIPKVIVSDNGSEFKGATSSYFQKMNIIHLTYEPGDHRALGIIDRFSQTLKNTIYKHFTFSQDTNWVDSLDNYIKAYNKSPHSSLGFNSPNFAEKHPSDMRAIFYQRIQNINHKNNLQIGDNVRVRNTRKVFDKGYEIKWSLKTYKIIAINGVNFMLDNGKQYRAHLLQKVTSSDPIEVQHKIRNVAKKAHKQNRVEQILKHKEGVEEGNVTRTLRSRKPDMNAVSDKYGKILW